MGHSKLTAKQEGFATDIANKKYDFHWEAYKANYATKTTSMNALYVNSCKLLANAKVALRIKEIEDKIKAKEQITLDQILVKLSDRCNLDMREMFNDDGTFKNIKELTQEQAMFLVGFDVNELWGYEKNEESGKNERTQIGWAKKVKIESIKDIMDMLIKVHGGYAKDKEFGGDNLDAIKELIDKIRK